MAFWSTLLGGMGASALSGAFGQSSARESMRFQDKMAQRGYQYRVADMKAAGLNPILAAGGAPATASGGAQASMDTSSIASTANQARLIEKQADLLEAQTDKTKVETGLAQTQEPKREFFEKLWNWFSETSGKFVSNAKAPPYVPFSEKAAKFKREFNRRAKGRKSPGATGGW